MRFTAGTATKTTNCSNFTRNTGANTLLFKFSSVNQLRNVWPEINAAGQINPETIDMKPFDSIIDRALAAGFPHKRLKLMLDFVRLKYIRFRGNKTAVSEGSDAFAKAVADTLAHLVQTLESEIRHYRRPHPHPVS